MSEVSEAVKTGGPHWTLTLVQIVEGEPVFEQNVATRPAYIRSLFTASYGTTRTRDVNVRWNRKQRMESSGTHNTNRQERPSDVDATSSHKDYNIINKYQKLRQRNCSWSVSQLEPQSSPAMDSFSFALLFRRMYSLCRARFLTALRMTSAPALARPALTPPNDRLAPKLERVRVPAPLDGEPRDEPCAAAAR